MKISYDAEIDALYIRLVEGKHECRNRTGNVPQVILENIPFRAA